MTRKTTDKSGPRLFGAATGTRTRAVPLPDLFDITCDADDPRKGTVGIRNAEGGVIATLAFAGCDNGIPSVASDSLIATPKGERPAAQLAVGDRVVTRDNGIQEIRWCATRRLSWRTLSANPHLCPVMIAKGALGDGLPERDMLVTPNQRILASADRTPLDIGAEEALTAAKHLVNNRSVCRAASVGVTYVHFLFDHHEAVLANGVWTECFQPADHRAGGIGNAQLTEMQELYPELTPVRTPARTADAEAGPLVL